MSKPKFTNALAGETSPHLLQHAHNPVQWYPWGEEALRRAKEEDKPILLSIGYSACHWCHVMEQESFANEQTANLMNEHFINIKVDREERPDLDAIYLAAVHMMTGGGGWPLTVFLTPDRAPFFGGTYFPPEERQGVPAFPRLLASIAQDYSENKGVILDDAVAIAAELDKAVPVKGASTDLTVETLNAAEPKLTSHYDAKHGGFGKIPKFPPATALTYLMRMYRRTGQARLLEVVENTLTRMANGGIYDHLGGGFHRSSVDVDWQVPRFEKMLFDNALLSRLYLDAHLLTGNSFYGRITEETLDYITREMISPEGGFYSAQDADSEGQEGKYYVWTPQEIEAVLGEADARLFCEYFSVSAVGNFEGQNVLNVPREAELVARLCRTSADRVHQAVSNGKKLLFKARECRAKPGRDEKILAAWNGLMLRSFAEAANGLAREDYRLTAVRNAGFLLQKLEREGRLLRAYKDGRASYNAYQEDYACVIDGLISLHEATLDRRWLGEASRLAEVMIDRFWDPVNGGFYFTPRDHESLIRRTKEYFDSATPSGNSVAAYALLRLWKLTGDEKWVRYSQTVLEAMAVSMARFPYAFGNMLCALDCYLSNTGA